MKYQPGDIIMTGPFTLKKLGDPDALHAVSEERGPHCIIARVVATRDEGIMVEAMYFVWDSVVESVDNWDMGKGNTTWLVPGSENKHYEMTELFNREKDDINTMLGWLYYSAVMDREQETTK